MSDRFVMYENVAMGIRMLRPSNWIAIKEESQRGVGSSVGLVNMPQGDPVCVISVREPCSDTLDQFFKLRMSSTSPPVIAKVIKVTQITIDHIPGKKITYIENTLSYGLDLLSVKNGRGYFVSILMRPEHMPEFMSLAEKMINSFQILK